MHEQHTLLYPDQGHAKQPCLPLRSLLLLVHGRCCNAILHCLDVGRLRDFDRGPPDFADDDFDPDGTVNDGLPGYRRLMDAE